MNPPLNPEWEKANLDIDFTGAVNSYAMDPKHQEFIAEVSKLAAIGASWLKDSSLEKWFPFTAESVRTVIAYAHRCEEITNAEMSPKLVYEELESALGASNQESHYSQLYRLIELYLTTPNTRPEVAEHYERLVEWYKANKRPDGSAPYPVSPDQQGFGNEIF